MAGRVVIRPRDYQRRNLDAIETHFFDGGINRQLCKAPTGTGKTVTFSAILEHGRLKTWRESYPPGACAMMVIAHREELLDQAAAKIRAANPGLMVAVEQGDRVAPTGADVVVASIQTLSARKFIRLRRLVQCQKYRIVIVDEAHHAAARTYRTALAYLGFLPNANGESADDDVESALYEDVAGMEESLAAWDKVAPKDQLLIGMTATPNRSDAIGLGCVFQSLTFTYGLRTAIDDGWLVPIVPWCVETEESLDEVHVQRGEFNQRELAKAVNKGPRNDLAVAAWQEHAEGRPTIAFTVDVAHAHDLAAAFQAHAIRAQAVSGETPKDDRRNLLRQFSDGQLDVLCNCMVLTEGTDLPVASAILHAKPTKSATLYEQMTGRGLRIHPNDPAGPARLDFQGAYHKPDCVVIDLVDVTRRHCLQTAPILYGIPPGVKLEGKALAEAAEEWDALKAGHPGLDVEKAFQDGPKTLEQLRARAELVDVWRIPDLGEFGVGRRLQWTRLEADVYRIQYPWADGQERLTVEQDLVGHWQVIASYRDTTTHATSLQTIAAELQTLEAAAQAAEGFVERNRGSVAWMKATDAGWRSKPATPKQLARLVKWRIPHDPRTLTAGQASELIDLWIARKGHGASR